MNRQDREVIIKILLNIRLAVLNDPSKIVFQDTVNDLFSGGN